MNNHIIFIGFMGSGKSTIARKLARTKNMNCIDLDIYLARQAGMSIPEIFEIEGESGFRARETICLENMADKERCILSCGGGIVEREDNRRILKKLGTVVYLKVTAEEAISRISRPETRPLLSGAIPPAELLKRRSVLYEQTADITIDTNGLPIASVLENVEQELRKRGLL